MRPNRTTWLASLGVGRALLGIGVLLRIALLGALASVASARSRKLSLPILALVVLLHQALILLPLLLRAGLRPTLASLELRVPGVLLQIFGGFALLWFMGRHLPSQRPTRVE